MFPGASNAPSGITIDLSKFDDIVPDEDGLTTRVGTGNRWIDVYKVLEPLNRMVVGGRHSQVGVGGFILGGESSLGGVISTQVAGQKLIYGLQEE